MRGSCSTESGRDSRSLMEAAPAPIANDPALAARSIRRCPSAGGGEPPSAVSPGGEGVLRAADVGDRIEPVRAPRVAAANPRKGEPAPSPRAVGIDGLQRVLGAAGQVPALHAEQGFERPPVGMDRSLGDRPGGPVERRSHESALDCALARGFSAPSGSAHLLSAAVRAVSTASKTSSVDACRAL